MKCGLTRVGATAFGFLCQIRGLALLLPCEERIAVQGVQRNDLDLLSWLFFQLRGRLG